MEIHLIRVQKTPTQRQWWAVGGVTEGGFSNVDLMKFAPGVSQRVAICAFERRCGRDVSKLIKYRGVCSPAEAAMTAADVLSEHEKERD